MAKTTIAMFSALLAALSLVAFCELPSWGATAPKAWDAGGGPKWDAILTKAKQEGSVVLAGPDPLPNMIAGFQADTGIKVEFVSGTNGALVARFDTEARAHHASIDIAFGGGTDLLTLMPEHLLTPIKPQLILPSVQEGKNWLGGKWEWWDDAGQYLFEGTTSVFGYLTYNGNLVRPNELRTWNDLLNPKFKGKIICYDPTAPGPGQGGVAAIVKVLGMDYLTKLIKMQDVKFVQSTDQEMAGLAHGEYYVAIDETTVKVLQYQQQGVNIKVALPAPMPGYLTHPDGVIVEATTAPHPNAAQVFINWWATQRGQKLYQDDALDVSNRMDVNKSTMPSFSIPKPGVKYFDDGRGQDYYVNERKKIIDQVTALIRGS